MVGRRRHRSDHGKCRKINLAAAVAEICAAVGCEQFDDLLLQLLRHAAQFGLEHGILQLNMADSAALQNNLALYQSLPVDEEDFDFSPIPETGTKIVGAQRVAVKRAFYIEVIDRQIRDCVNGRTRVAGACLIEQPIHRHILIVVGKAKHHPVASRDLPAGRKSSALARDMREATQTEFRCS